MLKAQQPWLSPSHPFKKVLSAAPSYFMHFLGLKCSLWISDLIILFKIVLFWNFTLIWAFSCGQRASPLQLPLLLCGTGPAWHLLPVVLQALGRPLKASSPDLTPQKKNPMGYTKPCSVWHLAVLFSSSLPLGRSLASEGALYMLVEWKLLLPTSALFVTQVLKILCL